MTKAQKILLVDKEHETRDKLTYLISEFLGDFELIGTATNALSGLKMLKNLNPDILIVDIDMADRSGFDMLDCVSDKNISIIITTEKHTSIVEAFKYNIADYILKPFEEDKLYEALHNAKTQRNQFLSSTFHYQKINDTNVSDVFKLAIHSQNEIEFIDIKSIVRMEAAGCYTNIFLDRGRKITVSKPLGEYENILLDDKFVRVHNSHIVNLNHIKKFIKKDGLMLKMMDDFSVPIAVRRKDLFENQLKRIAI